jgi:putative membrane protein
VNGASLRALQFTTLVAVVGLVWSGIGPYDRATWALEVAPVVIVLPLLWLTRKRFPLTPLLYVLIAVHAAILMLGGHYTYARVPPGDWVREAFDLARNHYDRLGHFAQGFIPAIAVREILLRQTPLPRGGWLFTLVAATCLAISACYEFLEWWTALLVGGAADAFLATQGDVWDTQWDMFLALCGALTAQVLLARWHDRQLATLPGVRTASAANP